MAEVAVEKVANLDSVAETAVHEDPESLVEGQDPVQSDEPDAAAVQTKPESGVKEVEQDAWTPNFKLKVLDQEKEIEEWARPLVNKDNEKQVRELFEKAFAADFLKTRRDEESAKAQQLQSQIEGYVGNVQKIRGYADKDFGRFLRELNIPPQSVIGWVRKELEKHEFLQREDIPAEVKKAYTDQEEQQRRAWELEEQNQHLSAQHVDVAVQAKSAELNQQLERPEVRDFSSAFDQRLAKPGAFKNFVIQHAANVWQSSKGTRDLTGQEAVDETLRLLGFIPNPSGNAGAENPKPNAIPSAPTGVTASPKRIVIPNVGSGSAVAMGKKPKSLEDLRKLAKEARS